MLSADAKTDTAAPSKEGTNADPAPLKTVAVAKSNELSTDDPSQDPLCPITSCTIRYPVRITHALEEIKANDAKAGAKKEYKTNPAADRHHYELSALHQWLKKNPTSPINREIIANIEYDAAFKAMLDRDHKDAKDLPDDYKYEAELEKAKKAIADHSKSLIEGNPRTPPSMPVRTVAYSLAYGVVTYLALSACASEPEFDCNRSFDFCAQTSPDYHSASVAFSLSMMLVEGLTRTVNNHAYGLFGTLKRNGNRLYRACVGDPAPHPGGALRI